MEVIRDGDPCPRPPKGSVITIGAYDGVHLGHRAVIAEVKLRAAELGAALRRRHVRSSSGVGRATRVRPAAAHRSRPAAPAIKATGVDYTVVLTFDERRAAEAGGRLRRAGARRLFARSGSSSSARTSTSATCVAATSACSRAMGADARLRGRAPGLGHHDRRPRGGVVDGHPPGARSGRSRHCDGDARPPPRGVGPGHRGRPSRSPARLPDRERGGAGRHRPARRWHLRGLVRAAGRLGAPRCPVARSPADVLRRPALLPARGLPAGLRRRPVRRAGQGAVRRQAP